MLISLIKYPVTTLGPGKRIGVWTSGCKRNCPGCMSVSFQTFDKNRERTIDSIVNEIKQIASNHEVNGITISGGEPFLQQDLIDLLKEINMLKIDDVLLYTGYKLEELNDKKEELSLIGVLVDGEYIDELNDNYPLRGSSNQNVYVLKKNLNDKYLEYVKKPRTFEIQVDDKNITVIGILPKNGHKYLKEILNK